MKRNKIKKYLAITMLFITLISDVQILPVSAGLKATVRDSNTIGDEINESVWNNASGDITAEDGVIIIPKTSTKYTKLITKSQATASEGVENLASIDATLQFTNLPKGEDFSLAFGLATIESGVGETGNLEIIFENKNGLQISVIAYSQEGKDIVMSSKKCGSLDKTEINATLTAKQKLILKVNGSIVCQEKVSVSGKGRVGFIQTGSCGVKITDINVVTYGYDRPENCDISENFEKGEFNANLLTSKMVLNTLVDSTPYVGIDEYKENKVFRFQDSRLCYLGTKYKYSNFEMSFDVPYIQRKNELDDEGNIVNKVSSQMIIAFGSEGVHFSDYGFEGSAEFLLFREISAITRKNGETVSLIDTFPFFDASREEGFSTKISVIDNTVTVFMKWISEKKWTEVMSYNITTPTGTIQIWGQDDCNWAIDNLKIVNKDMNPALVEVDYESSVLEVPEDYDYQPQEKVYQPQEVEEKSVSPYVIIPIFAAVCVVVFMVVVLLVQMKNRKRGGGNNDQ